MCAVCSASLFVINAMLLAEMNGRRNSKREVFVQFEVAKHTNRKARTIVVYLGIPLLASLGIDISVVLQLDILYVKSKQKAIVEPSLVDVRAILHLSLLCRETQDEDEQDERYEASIYVCAHRNNNVNMPLFIA